MVRYGQDGKKTEAIHIIDHKGLGSHYHKWANGKPIDGETHALTAISIVNYIRFTHFLKFIILFTNSFISAIPLMANTLQTRRNTETHTKDIRTGPRR